MEIEKYPSNSDKSREVSEKPEASAEKTRGAVVTNEVKTKRNLAEVLFSEDLSAIGDYILKEVVIPGAKELLWQIVTNSLSMGLFGTGADVGRSKSSSTSRVPYGSYYGGETKSKSLETVKRWGVYDYDKIIYQTRTDAILVLESLCDDIEHGYFVTVGDLYERSNIVTDNPMTQKYGWTNLDGGIVVSVKGGFGISLPRPTQIN